MKWNGMLRTRLRTCFICQSPFYPPPSPSPSLSISLGAKSIPLRAAKWMLARDSLATILLQMSIIESNSIKLESEFNFIIKQIQNGEEQKRTEKGAGKQWVIPVDGGLPIASHPFATKCSNAIWKRLLFCGRALHRPRRLSSALLSLIKSSMRRKKKINKRF